MFNLYLACRLLTVLFSMGFKTMGFFSQIILRVGIQGVKHPVASSFCFAIELPSSVICINAIQNVILLTCSIPLILLSV